MELVSGLDDHKESSETIKDPGEHPNWAGLPAETPDVVRAQNSGYVESMNLEEILDAVVNKGTKVVEIPWGPGNFVSAGLPLVKVWPPENGELESGAGQEANRAFVLGKERSFQQDLAFGLRQLSDILLKGLSPVINGPTTAMQAMDRMEAVFIDLGQKSLPHRVQRREANETEVLVKVGYPTFDELVGLAFDQVRRAAFTSGRVAVLERLLEILNRALQTNSSDERQQALWNRVYAVARQAPQEVSDPHDTVNLMLRAVRVVRSMTMNQRVRSDAELEQLAEFSGKVPDKGKVRETIGLLRKRIG